MRLSIQGYKGSFHAIAAKKIFGDKPSLIYRDSFSKVFNDVISGKSDLALVAIENSNAGSINEVYDLLLKKNVKIIGEVYMRIVHSLIAVKGAKLKDISNVYSHPMALLQCDVFLEKKLPNAQVHERHDTAESIEYVSKLNNLTSAAIGSEEAARLHGMSIIKKEIENDKHNYTRFIVISTKKQIDKKANKTSIVITTKNTPGSLYRVLGVFANSNINLSKIESRPIIGRGWNYFFYLDCDAGINTLITKGIIKDLRKHTNNIVVLGSYKKGRVIS